MKKLLSLFMLLLMSASAAISQCPGCITNMSCISVPAKPTICPDTLPDGYALQYYETDVSFYLPAEFVDANSGFNVTLNELHVTGVIGMPFGLSFQSSAVNDIFYPSSNPPSTEYGCAKFCGTPLQPGTYYITVYVTAYVNVLGINQESDDSFVLPITILPSTSGNTSFTSSASSGCAPLTASFTSNFPSGGNPNYHYSWDFGNGNQSSLEAPPAQTFNLPGTYIVSLQTDIDTFGYFLSSVTVNNSDCEDLLGGQPDYYIKIREGATEVYNNAGSYVENTVPATFNFPTLTLNNSTYTIEVWDNDIFMGGGQTGDDDCSSVSFNGHTSGQYNLVNGSLSVSFFVDHPILNYADTDTIIVYPIPAISLFETLPNDTICAGDSVTFVVHGGDSWQWYLDGMPVINQTDSIYHALVAGEYQVMVYNAAGCQQNGPLVNVSLLAAPPYPNFYPSGNMLQTMITGYAYQWYFEGSPIVGATSASCPVSQTGNYALELIASSGCTSMSSPFYAVAQSISEPSLLVDAKIYPNPASDKMTLEFANPAAIEVMMQICDMRGRVLQSRLLGDAMAFNESIDVSALANGLYMLVLQANGIKTVIRFAVDR